MDEKNNKVTKANNIYLQICNGIIEKKEISTNVKTKIMYIKSSIPHLTTRLYASETRVLLDKHDIYRY